MRTMALCSQIRIGGLEELLLDLDRHRARQSKLELPDIAPEVRKPLRSLWLPKMAGTCCASQQRRLRITPAPWPRLRAVMTRLGMLCCFQGWRPFSRSLPAIGVEIAAGAAGIAIARTSTPTRQSLPGPSSSDLPPDQSGSSRRRAGDKDYQRGPRRQRAVMIQRVMISPG